MTLDVGQLVRAARRNRAGLKALLFLDRRGRATIADISREIRVRPERVRAALRGQRGVYRREHSLSGLGAARPAARRGREEWEITPEGSEGIAALGKRLRDDPYVRELVDVMGLHDEVPRNRDP